MDWLKKEVRGKHLYGYIVGCVIIILIWDQIALSILIDLLKIDVTPVTNGTIPMLTLTFPFMLAWSAFKEEMFFRFPLAIAVQKKWSTSKTLIIALLLSVIFGIRHGDVSHIFIQGVAGFIYSILFLKCGGYRQNNIKALIVTIKALVATSAAHFLHNGILVLLAIADGETMF